MQTRLKITVHNELADGVNVVLEVFPRADDEVFADLVQPLGGHGLERSTHDRVVLQHGVELVDGQGEQTTVGLGADAGHPPSVRQQTDLCAQGTTHIAAETIDVHSETANIRQHSTIQLTTNICKRRHSLVFIAREHALACRARYTVIPFPSVCPSRCHLYFLLHCALSLAAQCIVTGPVGGFVCMCLWVCYHDNSKLRASIFTKLDL